MLSRFFGFSSPKPTVQHHLPKHTIVLPAKRELDQEPGAQLGGYNAMLGGGRRSNRRLHGGEPVPLPQVGGRRRRTKSRAKSRTKSRARRSRSRRRR